MCRSRLSLHMLVSALLAASTTAQAAPVARWTTVDLPGMTVFDVNGQGKVVGRRVTAESPSQATVYSAGTYTDLVPVSAGLSRVESISDNGRMVGAVYGAVGQERWVEFTGNGGTRDITPTFIGTSRVWVNDRGDVAGNYQPAADQSRAFLTHADGTGFPIGPLGGQIHQINNLGTVIGYHHNDFAKDRDFIATRDGASQYLPSLGGTVSRARDLNNLGQVVGASDLYQDTNHHATIYENGVLRDLGTFNGVGDSDAYAINDAGQIVGSSDLAGGGSHAFLYEGGVMKDIGSLGGARSWALSINNLGQVIGYSETTSDEDRLDWFLYDQGQMVAIDDLLGSLGHWDVRSAKLADNGYIAGLAYDWDTGVEHAFLLRLSGDDGGGGELPEPATPVLALAGVAAAALARRRRG